MTDIIYERAAAREATIWNPFQFNGPFGTVHQEERITLFGMYANTYLHGHNYLEEIEAEDLQRLVDTYNAAIAQITNEEAMLVLDVAAKRYVESIETQIHTEWKATREKEIDALADEYDAKIDALEADREAITTMTLKVELERDKALQKIKELEIQTELEDVAQQLVDVDITEQELRAARADLDILNAQLEGLNIQLAITQVALDKTNTDLQITEAENEEAQVGIRISETEVQESNVDLDITNAGIEKTRAEVKGSEIQHDIKEVAIRVSETNLDIAETEAKEYQYDAEISGIEADTAKLDLVDSELLIAQADERIEDTEYQILQSEGSLITARTINVETEKGFIETYTTVQEILDGKQLEHDQARHDFDVGIIQKETDFEDGMKDKKVDALTNAKRDIIDKTRERKYEDAQDRADMLIDEARAAEALKDAAIEAANMLAGANLMTELTHTLGEGSALEPSNVTWDTVTSI